MNEAAEFLWGLARDITWIDVFDIFLVSYFFYKLFQLIRGGRAFQMVLGTMVLVLFFFVSRWAELTAVNWLLRNTLAYVGFAVIVLYQQELRKALAQLGQAPLFRFLDPSSSKSTIDEIVFSVLALAQRRIGGIVVLERDIGLRSYIEGGVLLDAVVTYDLLLSIFNPKSPLHDGAVIVQADRVAAAACFLPISINPALSKTLGTRHRAAIGITEDTDAVAVVVSEETGAVSFVENGTLHAELDSERLRALLREAMGQSGSTASEEKEGEGSSANASTGAGTPTTGEAESSVGTR